jgi:hypothetical protein
MLKMECDGSDVAILGTPIVNRLEDLFSLL